MSRSRGLGVALVMAALIATMPFAHADSRHQLRLTPKAPSTLTDVLTPLTGSASRLIFSQQSYLAGDTDPANQVEPPYISGPKVLYARSKSGHLTRLGLAPESAALYSVVGSVVAAGDFGVNEFSEFFTHRAFVWRTTGGHPQLITLPKSDQYLSAAPGGIVYATRAGVVKMRTLAGRVTTLGTPFAGDSKPQPHFGTADSSGVVVSGDGLSDHVAYVSFKPPHVVTTLDGASADSGSSTQCEAVVGEYAACTSDDNSDDFPPEQAMLVPLNGDESSRAGTDCSHVAPAVSGTTVLWACSGVSSTLFSAPVADTDDVSTSVAAISQPLVSAYGGAVGASADEHSLYTATSADQVSPLISPRASPVSVDAFALSAGKLAYADNQRVASRPGQLETLFERSLRVHGTNVKASNPAVVATGTQPLAGSVIGISRHLTVYATPSSFDKVTLHVVSATGDRAFDDVDALAQPQIYRNEVLFMDEDCGCNEVYDAASHGKPSLKRFNPNLSAASSTAALWGHFIAYATSDGAIYRKNFVTSRKVKLAGPIRGDAFGVRFAVYDHGNWVGWHAQGLPYGGRAHFTSRNRLRNGKTRAPTVHLGHRLYGLTSAGALLDRTEPSFESRGSILLGSVPLATPFWLRSYTGRTRLLLTKRSFAAGPQIAGGVVAWAGPTGALHAASLP